MEGKRTKWRVAFHPTCILSQELLTLAVLQAPESASVKPVALPRLSPCRVGLNTSTVYLLMPSSIQQDSSQSPTHHPGHHTLKNAELQQSGASFFSLRPFQKFYVNLLVIGGSVLFDVDP